ncbi:MAG: HIT family protein [Planctomycetota bacterium]
MSVQDCIFCKIIAGQIPCTKIYENDFVLAFMDVGPVSEGHVLVVFKEHTCSVDQTDPLAMAEIAKVLPKLAGSVKNAMDADGYNVLCNNGASAGQVVEHMHFHIIPRKENDGVFNQWPSFQYPEGKAKEIAAKIREKISH